MGHKKGKLAVCEREGEGTRRPDRNRVQGLLQGRRGRLSPLGEAAV